MSTDTPVGGLTTVSLDVSVRDQLRDLRDREDHDNYTETLAYLLACHAATEGDDPTEDGVHVGDCTLSQEHPGQVTVRRDGDIVGTIDAQGLREAADLDDQVLSGWWAIWRTYFDPTRNGGSVP